MSEARFCSNCGAKIEYENDMFCSQCGNPIEGEIDSAPEEKPASGKIPEKKARMTKKLPVIVIAVVLIAAAALAVKYIFLKGTAIGYPVQFSGDNVVFLNKNDNNRLYKMNLDGSGKTRLDSEYTNCFAVEGGWIYFDSFNMYKIRDDGTAKIKLEDSSTGTWAGSIAVAEGWVYYAEDYGEQRNIIKIGTDGNNKTRQNSDFSINIALEGEYVYYVNVDDSHKIYRIKTDGTGREKIGDDKVPGRFMLKNGWIYYSNESDSSRLYKIKIDGTGKTKLCEDYSQDISVSGEWVYYSNANDEGKIYRVKKDGSGKAKVNNVKSLNISANEEFIYFSAENSGGKLMVIENDVK
ncbi:MAG TPA: DUF5050 domain-containing protein [Desulfitobacteriaceae bacterium]|nr:DUF5050 domain-containing protein [Desulfitobacteriaceae bacterium]